MGIYPIACWLKDNANFFRINATIVKPAAMKVTDMT